MLVLSLPHPYAFAAIAYAMDVVPIYYKTMVRGRALLHAPRLQLPKDSHVPADVRLQWEHIVDGWRQKWGTDPPYVASFRRMSELSGGILGSIEIIDCVREHPSPWYDEGWKWCLVLADSRPLPFTPCPGLPGIWDLPSHIEVPV